MTLLEKISRLEAKQKRQSREIQRLQEKLNPKPKREPKKRVSRYVPKIKHKVRPSKLELLERMDRKYMKRFNKAA